MRHRSLLLALLAALAVAVPVGEAAGAGKGDRAAPARLKAFKSCATMVRYARRHGTRIVRERTTRFVPVSPPAGGGTPPGAGEDGGAGGGQPVPQAAPPVTPVAGEQESQTNVQEAGVDEPDIVKARGSLVFALIDDRLHAVDASATPPRLLGTLHVRGSGGELLVRGDRLLVMAQEGLGGGGFIPLDGPVAMGAAAPPSEWLSRSVLTEVDVSDPGGMRVVRTLDVEGRYMSARLSGRTARVVISSQPRALDLPDMPVSTEQEALQRRWQRSVQRARSARWLPSSVLRTRRTGRRVQRSLVNCRRVRRAAYFSGLEMITVLTIDFDKGLPAVDSDTVMSDGETVYASSTSLYVGTERWLGDDPTLQEVESLSHTAVHKFDASEPGQTTYRASGEVPGYLLNQWSLSEQDGVLRVATTDRPSWWSATGARESESAVRTYRERDGRLVQLGRVGGLGKGERIFAVRFMGDTGFVVTFRQTDPLYALDLSDPAAPRLVGELKVPGYSAYLHPVGDGLLLGVGQAATEQGGLRGVQVSLFDVSDLRRPEQVDQLSLGSRFSQTEVETDHHAFLWWQPRRLAVVPVSGYEETFGDVLSSFTTQGVRVDAALRRLQRVGAVTHPGLAIWPGIRRALVIGDRLVTVSPAGVMSSALSTLGDGRFTEFPAVPVLPEGGSVG